MIHLSYRHPKGLSITTEFVDRYVIRELPGFTYHKPSDSWHASLSWGSLVTLRGAFGDDLTMDEDVRQWSWDEYNKRVAPSLFWRERYEGSDDTYKDSGVYDGLFPFQKACVNFLVRAEQAIFADPMGAGKTVQTIRAIKMLEESAKADIFVVSPLPVLVVCPNTIKMVWQDEFAKWWPELNVQVISGTVTQRRKALAELADVYVINYEGLRAHSKLGKYGTTAQKRCVVCDSSLRDEKKHPQHRCQHCPKELNKMDFGTVVIDESHRIKDPKALQTRASWAVAHEATYRYALTGTPICNNPSDLWSICHAISPDEYPTRTKFLNRYTEQSFNFFGGMEILGLKRETKEEFFKILDPRFRRLPLEVILPQLPPVVRTTRRLEMGTKQAKAYRDMRDYMAARFEEEVLAAPNPLTKLGRLMQFASAYANVREVEVKVWTKRINPETGIEEKYGMMTEQQQVTLADPSNKIDALIDLLDETGQEPLVVMSASKQLINLASQRLEKNGISHGCITGDVDTLQRQGVVHNFQTGQIRVVLGTVQAAGEGITLTKANRLVWLMRHWSSSQNEQAERRILRIGSEVHSHIEYIDLISAGTVEEYQREVLEGKLERLEEIVRDKEMMMKIFGV